MTLDVKPLAFTVPNAATYTGLSRSRLYKLMGTGDLPSIRIGGRRMILRDALDACFAKLADAGAS